MCDESGGCEIARRPSFSRSALVSIGSRELPCHFRSAVDQCGAAHHTRLQQLVAYDVANCENGDETEEKVAPIALCKLKYRKVDAGHVGRCVVCDTETYRLETRSP